MIRRPTDLSSIQLLNFSNRTQNMVNLVFESAVSLYLLKSAVFICHIFAFLESAATMNLTARDILLLHNLCESTDWVFILVIYKVSFYCHQCVLKMESKVSLGTCNTKYNNYTLDSLPVNLVFLLFQYYLIYPH